MKTTMQKWVAMALACVMLLSILPVFARAAEPEWEMQVLEDVQFSGENTLMGNAPAVPAEAETRATKKSYHPDDFYYAFNIWDAADVLREGLKARENVIEVGFSTDQLDMDYINDVVNNIVSSAFSHTRVPTEGDYLLWQFKDWECGASYGIMGGQYYLVFTFIFNYYTDAQQEAEMDAAVAELLAELNPQGRDYDKIKTVYDWICDNVVYDYDNLFDDSYMLKHTAYAALMHGTSVCQGYALLLYRLALEMGIDCRVIAGDTDGDGWSDHNWNIVALDDLYYNLDATWDTNFAANDNYQFFLRSDDNMMDHARDLAYQDDGFYSMHPMSETDYDPFYEPEGPDYSANFKGGSLSLNGVINVNFYVELTEDFVNHPDARVLLCVYPDAYWVPVSEARIVDGLYVFSCPVPAKQMADNVSATLYLGDDYLGDEYDGVTCTYSVVEYCRNKLESPKTSASLKNLLIALLNYGAAAQKYLDYMAHDPVNNLLTYDQRIQEPLKEEDLQDFQMVTTGSQEGIVKAGASLILEADTTVRYYVQLEAGRNVADFTFQCGNRVLTPVATNDPTIWYVDVIGINAKDLDEMYPLTVGGLTVNYGPMTYVLRKMHEDQTMVDMVTALYHYNQAANAYLQ